MKKTLKSCGTLRINDTVMLHGHKWTVSGFHSKGKEQSIFLTDKHGVFLCPQDIFDILAKQEHDSNMCL